MNGGLAQARWRGLSECLLCTPERAQKTEFRSQAVHPSNAGESFARRAKDRERRVAGSTVPFFWPSKRKTSGRRDGLPAKSRSRSQHAWSHSREQKLSAPEGIVSFVIAAVLLD